MPYPNRAVRLVALSIAITAASASAQTVDITPTLLSFSAVARGPNPPPQSVTISVTGAAQAPWSISGQHAPWLTVAPVHGTGSAQASFSVNIAGLPAGQYWTRVDFTTADPVNPRDSVEVLLDVADPTSINAARYLVEFKYVGYTGLITSTDCVVRANGYDRLWGTLSAVEAQSADEDLVYTGTLVRVTDIDVCDSKRIPGKGADERMLCTVRLKGHALVRAELEVYGEDGRGAWLKTRPAPGPSRSSVQGNCDPPETNQIRSDYPTAPEGGGATPNGQSIDDAKAVDPSNRPVTLSVNGVARLRVGTYPPDQPDGWTLRVVMRLP